MSWKSCECNQRVLGIEQQNMNLEHFHCELAYIHTRYLPPGPLTQFLNSGVGVNLWGGARPETQIFNQQSRQPFITPLFKINWSSPFIRAERIQRPHPMRWQKWDFLYKKPAILYSQFCGRMFTTSYFKLGWFAALALSPFAWLVGPARSFSQ